MTSDVSDIRIRNRIRGYLMEKKDLYLNHQISVFDPYPQIHFIKVNAQAMPAKFQFPYVICIL